MNQHHMTTTFIGEAYLPSIEPISSLKPILLRDLRLEVHHRGRVLVAKTFCEPIQISAIQNAIEDVEGNVNRLSIYNLPSATPLDKVLPQGAVVAVKEPYFKAAADGGVMVRVDHPSDFVMLKASDSSVPPQWRTELKATMTASQLKDEGNTAFRHGKWQEAAEFYTEAIAKSDNDTELRSTLHRNRAQVHLNLGQYEFASDDAIEAVYSGDNLPDQAKMFNVKSYFRAGRAHYQLGDFCAAKQYLDQALGFDPTDKSVIAELARTEQRIVEERTGEFDFAATAQSAAASHRRLDHATFTNNTRIGSAGKRGRGLFATKDINHGSLVMIEKAFCAVFGDEIDKTHACLININTDRIEYGTHAERHYAIIDKMRRNPKQASKFLDLFDGGNFKTKQVIRVDGDVVLDTFQAQAIAELNGFGCPGTRSSLDDDEETLGGNSTGIWLHASYMNHSCLPNTARAFIGDMMIVRATRDIAAGEEILTSYQPAAMVFPERREKFKLWGFKCDCPLCLIERQLPASAFTDRGRVEKEAKAFIAANPRWHANGTQPVSAATLTEAKDILRRLEATYDKYDTLPRMGCVDIDFWLMQAGIAAFAAELSPMLDLASASRMMRDLGYKVNVRGSGASIDRANGVVCPEAGAAAMYNKFAWRQAGKPEAAAAFDELAREVYLAICGAMEGFEERFGHLEGLGL